VAQNYIEHVNITVSDLDRTADVLIRLFDWHIRWRGESALGGHTIHVGNDRFYLAVYSPELAKTGPAGHRKGRPLNHIGIVVDDLDGVEQRVIAEGYETFSHGDYEPGRRFYFFDRDGIEYEIVSYA
jgi:catechol 2,3-dioxygenase-like lactoylglutathione lyase family enzyme